MSSRSRPGFAELVAGFLAAQISHNTRAAYGRDLEVFVAWCEITGTEPLCTSGDDIDRYRLACVDAGSRPATVARRVSTLSSFFTHAVDRGALDETPIGALGRPDTDASPTADLDPIEVAALLEACGRLGSSTGVLIGLLLFDGLRLSEVLAADACDVTAPADSGERFIIVFRRQTRDALRIDTRTVAYIAEHLDGRTDGPLLPSASPGREGQRLTRFGADYLLKRAGSTAGLDAVLSANRLRRAFVGTSHRAGHSLDTIRGRLGHVDVRTTRRHLGP